MSGAAPFVVSFVRTTHVVVGVFGTTEMTVAASTRPRRLRRRWLLITDCVSAVGPDAVGEAISA